MGPEVVINGSLAGVTPGLAISGDDGGVIALVVNGFEGGGLVLSRLPFDPTPSRNVISGNYIGTDPTGSFAVPNAVGISIGGFGTPGSEARDNVVEDNLISGNISRGISTCDVKGTQIISNLIGTDRTGILPLGNGALGITQSCTGALEQLISGNTIAFNGDDGYRSNPDFRFGNFHHENRFSENSIHSNGGLGINLSPPPFGTIDGVTPNDPLDADILGSNFLQNFPVITSITVAAGSTTINGTLHSAPNQSFVVEMFSNDTADPSGHGEGQTFLDMVTANTDAGGNDSFSVVLPFELTAGKFVTGTATDAGGNTSEFSEAVEVVQPDTTPPGDCNGDEKVDAGDISAAVLEIFDGDGTAPPYGGGTFPGTVGCDANEDGKVDAGDIACIVLIIFGGRCGEPATDPRGGG